MRTAAEVAQRIAAQEITPATQAALNAAHQASQAQLEMRAEAERVNLQRVRVEAAAAQASTAAGVAAAAAGLASSVAPSQGVNAGVRAMPAPSMDVDPREEREATSVPRASRQMPEFVMDPASGSVQRMVVVDTARLAQSIPLFDGRDPVKENYTAMQMIQSTNAVFRMNPFLTEFDLMHMVTSRFKKDGLAFAWWHAKVQGAPFGQLPYDHWDIFCEDFLAAMGTPDMGSAVRIELAALQMKGEDLPGYIADFRQCVIKLENLAQPMSQHDQVFNFLKGLPKMGRWAGLRRAVDTSVPLSSNIEKVMKKYHKDKIINLVSSADDRPSPRRQGDRRPARVNAISSEGAWADEEYYEDYYAYDEEASEGIQQGYYDDEAELSAVRAENPRGRGRGF
jgi:hypothetical protein